MYYSSGISENIFWNVHSHRFEENEKEVQSTDYISSTANQRAPLASSLSDYKKQIVLSENGAWARKHLQIPIRAESTAGHLPKCSCEKSWG